MQQQQQRACVDAAADALLQRLQERNRRGEAKAWLVSTLADAGGCAATAAARLACFLPYVDTAGSSSISSPAASCKAAQLALLALLVDAQPGAVSALLLPSPNWLAAFFTASPARISAWFGHFNVGGRFGFGAKALANFALAQRASVWHLLVWRGKHSQSPVAVAARPHYFGELDVPATIGNLARHCPRFWSSDELQRSCQGGEWLALDRDAVSKELRRLLLDSHSSRRRPLQQQLETFVLTADWALLCQRLLPLLPEEGLLQVARALSSAQQQQPLPAAGRHHGSSSSSSSHRLKRSSSGGGGGGSLQHWLGAQAAFEEAQQGAEPAPAAAALPCAADLSPLVLQGLSGVSSSSSQSSSSSSSKGAWSLDELLLANALHTAHRSQLLLLLWPETEEQEDEAAAVVTAAAEAVWKAWLDGSLTAPGAAHSQQPSSHQQPLLPSKLRPLKYPQHLLRLLLVAWLLRLQLLLQLAAHAEAAAAAAGHHEGPDVQQQQQLPLPQGWTCRLLPPQKPQEQQRQPAPGEAGPKSALKRGAPRSPRRRSSSSSSSDRGGDSDSSRRRRRSKHKQRRSSTKQHKNKKRRRARDSQEDSSSGGHQRRKRRRRASSSDDEEGEDGGRRRSGWDALDFDAAGALLPADFDAAAAGGGGGSAAGATGVQQPRSGVAATLASLRAGGALWRSPAWAACVPAARGGGAVVRFQGSTAEVADALAWMWLYSVLASAP